MNDDKRWMKDDEGWMKDGRRGRYRKRIEEDSEWRISTIVAYKLLS